MSPNSPSKPPPSSSQVLARLLGEEAGNGAGGRARYDRRIGFGVLALVVLTILLLALSVWPLIRLRSQPPRTVADAKPEAPLIAEFAAATRKDLALFEGRSLFAIPGPPAPRAETARKTTAPTRYGGPAIVGMINDQVWFSDGKRLGSADDAAGGLKVISINAPWSARLEWEGGEFEVEFIARSPLLASADDRGGKRITPNPRSLGDLATPPRAASSPRPSSGGSSGGGSPRGSDGAPPVPPPMFEEPAPPAEPPPMPATEPPPGEPPQTAPPPNPTQPPPDPGSNAGEPHAEPGSPAPAPTPTSPAPTEPDPEKSKS